MEIKLTNVRSFFGKRMLMMIMRTFIFLLCTTVFSFNTEISSAQEKITIDTDKLVSIDEVFDIITKQTKYHFIYPENLFESLGKVQLKKGTIRVDKLLNQSIKTNDFKIILSSDNTILIKKKNKLQQKQVSGKVTGEGGLPLAGVTVQVKGTLRGVATDFNGAYSIVVADAANVLMFSYIGFETQEIIVGNQNDINVSLKESISQLDEVTINAGYYNTSQREATGSIAKITAKTIEKQPVNNPMGAMQGHMSGVNIVQTTGVTGGGYTIEIRGKNFINGGADPLFIIDGVPYGSESIESFTVSTNIIDQGNVSPLNAINPADIASIEVLKDADATAIYGSRGANGVVLITTKKGKAGKTKVTVNVSTSLGEVTHFQDLLNTEQYLELRLEGVVNRGREDRLNNPRYDLTYRDLVLWDQNRYTDWQKVLIGGTAYRNNAQVSLSGGNEQTQFLFSGAYQKETTVFPGDANYNKGSFRSNINHHSKDNRFKINFSTTYTIEDNQLPLGDFTGLSYTLEPNAPALYDEDGNLNWENDTFKNPLANLENKYRAQTNTLIANTVFSYQLLPSLGLKANLGYTNMQLESYNTNSSASFEPRLAAFGLDSSFSSLTTNSSNRQSWIVEPQLNWQQQWGDAKLHVLIGSSFQKQSTEQFAQRGTGFTTNLLLLNLSAAETIEAIEDNDSKYSYQAFFGRINFNWKDKYILNLTGRRDGSSRFGPGKQFGNFGAVGAAWLFTEEAFLKDNTVLSFGKLRSSYGITGSDNIGDYKFLDTYNITSFDYNGVSVLQPTGIFNPNYAWEENKKLEVALELGFFKDRVYLNTAWYQNRSSNQLIGIPLAATTGFSSLTGNFDATVENTGFEVDLRTVNIQNEHFKWTTTFNITALKNKLLKFDGLESSTFANTYRIGEPLTEFRLYQALGVNPDTGFYQFEDFNDDGSITSLDRQWFEDLAPKFYGGLGNTLTYKNVSLDFFFQFKKQKGFNHLFTRSTVGTRRNGSAQLYNRWQESGDTDPIQLAGFSTNGSKQSSSDAAVSDASFIRLRNITLNYKVPKTMSYGMDLNLYVQGQNLLTITNYDGGDPEQRLSQILPPLQQITLGLQLSF